MKIGYFAPLAALIAICLPLRAEAPGNQVHSNPLGFSYSLPADWEAAEAPPAPEAKQQAAQNATSVDEKKGIACLQVALTARHGTPADVIVIVALPFGCYGQSIGDADLPGFGMGASQGLKQDFDIANPIISAYSLGKHQMWVERAAGTPKGQTDPAYTVEIVCSLLKKAAVCWMTMAVDEAGLQAFEHGAVTLDGDPAPALVPTEAFASPPTSSPAGSPTSPPTSSPNGPPTGPRK